MTKHYAARICCVNSPSSVEAHDYAWAKRMKRLLLDACHEVAKRDEKRLSESEYKAVQKRYRTILTQGERELPPIPPRQRANAARSPNPTPIICGSG